MKRILAVLMACAFVLAFSGLTMATDEKKAEEKPAAAPAPDTKPEAVPAPDAKPADPAPDAKPAAAPASEAKPAEMPNLSGKWGSNLVGDVTIEQTGSKIAGFYSYTDEDDVTQEGKIEGVIEGKTIRGQWWERAKVGGGEESRGDLEWKISDDGKMMIGWYRNEGDEEKADWNLTR